jgi:hypothetical protein
MFVHVLGHQTYVVTNAMGGAGGVDYGVIKDVHHTLVTMDSRHP